MKTWIDDVVVPCPLLHLGLYNDAQSSLQEAFYTPVLHILYMIRVRVLLVDLVLVHLVLVHLVLVHLVLVHLDVAIRRD